MFEFFESKTQKIIEGWETIEKSSSLHVGEIIALIIIARIVFKFFSEGHAGIVFKLLSGGHGRSGLTDSEFGGDFDGGFGGGCDGGE